MTLSRWLALAALLLALASPQALAARNGRADALYAELDLATQAYRQGLEQVAAGESETGRETMRQAAGKLLDAAGRCQKIRGCDVGRFVAAYDALLQLGAERAAGGGEGFSRENGEKPGAGEGVLASMPAAQRSVAMLKGRDLRELIELNEPVQAALMDWLTWMRPALMTSWENYQYMRFLMWPEYEQAGLPEALLFGILAKESNGRVHAVSRAGAAGPLQFMPATGARFGLGWRDGFDTRYDPQLAARASVLYFNERFAELGDELEFAIAAYNGGEGRARRLKETAGGKSFWDPAVYGQLPPETRDYVPYVLAAAWLFLHPEDYGLEFPQVQGAATVIRLEQPASLYQLAICVGGPGNGYFRALRNLNPRYEPHQSLAAGTELRVPVAVPPAYQAHCLQGPRAEMAARLVAAHKPGQLMASAGIGTHRVKAGDTLSSISRRYRCQGAVALAKANGLRQPYLIKPGQQLRLVGCRA
ncbi:MAG TPA: transglycosylase SLT domain-containing protein [Arenimonas sp.]|nr:transglycosylase SLT domain-containing protein [Arenimonas sp.]